MKNVKLAPIKFKKSGKRRNKQIMSEVNSPMPSKTKLNLLSNSKFKSTSPEDSNRNFNFSDDVVLREEEKSAIIAKPG